MTDDPANPYAAPAVGPLPAPVPTQGALIGELTPVEARHLLSLSRRIRVMGVCAGIVAGLHGIVCIYLAALGPRLGPRGPLLIETTITAAVLCMTAIACWWRPRMARWVAIGGGGLLAASILQPHFWTIPIVIVAIAGLLALVKGSRLYGTGRILHATLSQPRGRARPGPGHGS